MTIVSLPAIAVQPYSWHKVREACRYSLKGKAHLKNKQDKLPNAENIKIITIPLFQEKTKV